MASVLFKLVEASNSDAFSLDAKSLELLKRVLHEFPASSPLDAIVADGVLNIHDVPNLVLLVSQLYHTDWKQCTLRKDSVVNLIRCIVHGLITLEYVKVDNVQQVYSILETSLTLLSMVPSRSWCCM